MGFGNKLKVFLFFIADVAALYAGLFITLLIRYGSRFYERIPNSSTRFHSPSFLSYGSSFSILRGCMTCAACVITSTSLKTLFLCLGVNAALAVLLFYLIPIFGIAPKDKSSALYHYLCGHRNILATLFKPGDGIRRGTEKVLFIGDSSASA